jgi:hypothetical protein
MITVTADLLAMKAGLADGIATARGTLNDAGESLY